ncbi:hypothetical protein P8452_48423 [Trifolium repens]|nr:hypothetical protein P8452_48423 [Trifolium repens]
MLLLFVSVGLKVYSTAVCCFFILIGNLNSKVGKANSTLLPEMESEDEGELAINGATSVSDSGFENDDF